MNYLITYGEGNKMSLTKYKSNVKYFTSRVNHYFFDVFKMHDYELTISEQNKGGTRASTYWHDLESGAGMITIAYSKYFISTTDKKEIDIVSFHEVWEAILSELQELAERRFISKKDISAATHRVIRRMENIIFPMIKDK